MGQINIGIAKIELGALAADKGESTAYGVLGYTEEGTAKLNWDDPTETEFNVEEIDTPIYIASKAGKKTFTFTIANPDKTTLQKVFGATVTGTGPTERIDFPDSAVLLEQSLKITPQQGFGLIAPRVKVTAKLTSDLGRANLLGVEVTATVMQPEKAGLKALSAFTVTP